MEHFPNKNYKRHIEYSNVSGGGRVSPSKSGYHIVPCHGIGMFKEHKQPGTEHTQHMKWIEENLTDKWTWFSFGGHPRPGISYCFKNEIDAAIFTLCRI